MTIANICRAPAACASSASVAKGRPDAYAPSKRIQGDKFGHLALDGVGQQSDTLAALHRNEGRELRNLAHSAAADQQLVRPALAQG